MSALTWTDALATGIKIIDDQHKTLIDLTNALASASPDRPTQACDLVQRLKDYAAQHFHIEEGYMQAFGYPAFQEHLAEHERFLAAVQGFEDSCAQNATLPAEILGFLRNWLVDHITGVDQKMGRFLEDYLR